MSGYIADAEAMIEFAGSRGIELGDDVVKPVVEFARKWRDNASQASVDEETKFWVATSKLAKLIAPSTPEALRTLSDYNRGGSSRNVRRVAWWASFSAWTILVLTLLFHSYHNTLATMIEAAGEAAGKFASVQSEVAAIALPDNTFEAKAAFVQSLDGSHIRYCAAARTWTIQVGLIQGLIPQGEGSIPQAFLNWILQWLPFLGGDLSAKLGGPSSILDVEEATFISRYHCGKETAPDELRVVMLSVPLGTDDAREIAQWAQVDLAFFAQFGLPLLYGLLGALASVVREFGKAVRDARFSPASGLVYALRVPLGALAGATVGVVIEPATLGSAAGLTSLGLAFGFGYAVELFFSLLDELLGRLTGKSAS